MMRCLYVDAIVLQLGVEAIRKEVLKVLSDDPTLQGLQQDIAAEHAGHRSSSGLRRRLPAARAVRSLRDDVPLADTWTEPSTAPGSPASEPRITNDTLELASAHSDWDGSDFELLPGPNPLSESDPGLKNEHASTEKESIGQKLAQWLQECSSSIASVMGGVCQGALSVMKGILQDCTKLMQDVASWCQRSIDTLRNESVNSFSTLDLHCLEYCSGQSWQTTTFELYMYSCSFWDKYFGHLANCVHHAALHLLHFVARSLQMPLVVMFDTLFTQICVCLPLCGLRCHHFSTEYGCSIIPAILRALQSCVNFVVLNRYTTTP